MYEHASLGPKTDFEQASQSSLSIAVVTPRFAISGVPLAQLRLARALADFGHKVELIIGNCDPHLSVPHVPGVKISVLGLPNVRAMLLPLIHYFRRTRLDIVFSAEDHLNAVVIVAAMISGSKAKISGSSHVTPFDTYSSTPFTKRWFLKQIVRATSWRADAQTCVSRDMVDQYRQLFASSKHVCVHNVIDDAHSRQQLAEPVVDPWFKSKEWPVIVAAGSLVPWKGFGDLIDAVGILKASGKIVRLVILGEGPLRGELEARVAELGLRDSVKLPGHSSNPLKYFSHADAFILSSHVEGMPTVLVEAMLAGTTPVATNCPTGPRELLQDGKVGQLVAMRDPAALAGGIASALENPERTEVLAGAVQPFRAETVVARHFELLGLGSDPRRPLMQAK